MPANYMGFCDPSAPSADMAAPTNPTPATSGLLHGKLVKLLLASSSSSTPAHHVPTLVMLTTVSH